MALPAQQSTFDTSNENWRCDGDPVSPSATWFSSGGNPGGHIRMTDGSTGGTWYFVAPAKFLGAKCDAYGKFLRYDQFADNHSNPNAFADVELIGNGIRLVFDHPILPFPTWTHYDLFLREDAGWRINTTTGQVPTQAQFKQVLANITSLRIRGEFHHFAVDFGGLDNVMLESNFRFDLDEDNSSGLTNGDFRADTVCTPSLQVLDDPLLTSEGPVDSISIMLLNTSGFDVLSLTGVPSNIQVVVYSATHLTLIGNNATTLLDYLAAIQLLWYEDAAVQPLRGVRQIEFRVYAGCGEAGKQRAFLPIYPPPTAGLPGDTIVCANTPVFSLFSVLKGFPEVGGFWAPATSSPTGFFNPAQDTPGSFAYYFPPVGECPGDTAFVEVTVVEPPSLRADTTLCYEDVLLLQIPPKVLDWTWSDGSQLPNWVITAPGVYRLNGQTEYCTFTDSVVVEFFTCQPCKVFVPNVFSPDLDGLNDVWQAFLPCRWLQFQLEVYDRWGSLVFRSEDPNQTWDGRIRGQAAQTGVYVWQLTWDAEYLGKVQTWREKGDVTIVR